jgi:segregation and condensation protein A
MDPMDTQDTQALPEATPEVGAAVETLAPEAPRFEAPKGFESKFRKMDLHLGAFDGPLDLLLHLIRETKLDILDLPMAEVTRQYMDYLHLMEELNLEIAAEFVAMAAHLLQIKSRLMLPRPPADEGLEDPREELVQKLLDYQSVKDAAQKLAQREQEQAKVAYVKGLDITEHARVEDEPIRATLFDLLGAYRDALKRLLPPPPVEVRTQPKTIEQRIQELMATLNDQDWHPFDALLAQVISRDDVVLTFLALLELVRLGKISLSQVGVFGEIRVKAA